MSADVFRGELESNRDIAKAFSGAIPFWGTGIATYETAKAADFKPVFSSK